MRRLWIEDWFFALLKNGSTYEQAKQAKTQPVALPHDWLIGDTVDLYRSGDGWYFKTLRYDPADFGMDRAILDFDGVYMDADVLVNGKVICTHRYGYTAFFTDVTDALRQGDNEIAVHVRYQSPNSRWYSGAGIFRDVHLLRLPAYHMLPDGFWVDTVFDGKQWLLRTSAEMNREGEQLPWARLLDGDGNEIRSGEMTGDGAAAALNWHLDGIRPWSLDDPCLYTLVFTLGKQEEKISIGFRETRFDPNEGFFLNGRHVKLHGVCLHHDLGCLGAAFYEKAAERQLGLMRRMGVNAIRTSHNPPARAFLDLCDRMGFLVIDELLDMWEEPKTPYDHARFFPDTWRQCVAEWVRRDRCHPSVIMWSIGNEIHDVFSEKGEAWTKKLTEEVHRHAGPCARVTFGSNYMPWEGGQRCAQHLVSKVYDAKTHEYTADIKIPGYNYAEKYYARHHQEHPDWVIYGSETGSHLQSRGIYHFPMDCHILSEEDQQCSALLNSMTSWGTQDLCGMLTEDLNTPYSMGQFIWSGIDYIGEPTPYHTRNCYFGQADTACLPKDSYYFYQAMWTDAPMIHIGMIWDWNAGQLIDVPVMTNGAFAELFLNGVSLGRKAVDRTKADQCLPRWQVPYQRGVLTACAYDARGKLLCREEKHSFGESRRIVLAADRKKLQAHCGDMAFVEISTVDEAGHPVENANDRMHVAIDGPGVLLGLDNGDSTDQDGYKTTSRRLFSGKLVAVIGAGEQGKITVRVQGRGLESASIALEVIESDAAEKRLFPALCAPYEGADDVQVRRIDLQPLEDTHLTPAHASARFAVAVKPQSAAGQPLRFRVTNREGVTAPHAFVTQNQDGTVTVTARSDGDYYLRATADNGADYARILSCQDVQAKGFPKLGLNPYDFIAGALYDVHQGDITPGNDQGFSFARDGFSMAGFSAVDFGSEGSDEITLPVFALDGKAYQITLWDGVPGQGGEIIDVLTYQKPSIWNVYQAETYRLPRVLTGLHCLCFSMEQKVHVKGFAFAKQEKAFRRHRAVDADSIYGDSFVMDDTAVRQIGNNVTLTFRNMRFAQAASIQLEIEGSTTLPEQSITVRWQNQAGETVDCLCRFAGNGESMQRFPMQAREGEWDVSFIFLPGSRFDFVGFRFVKEE